MTPIIVIAVDLFHRGNASCIAVVERCCMGGQIDCLQPLNLLIAATQ